MPAISFLPSIGNVASLFDSIFAIWKALEPPSSPGPDGVPSGDGMVTWIFTGGGTRWNCT